MNKIREALRQFYEEVAEKYPEEEEVYQTLRGRLRKAFVIEKISRFNGSILDVGCNRCIYLSAYSGGERFGIDISFNILKKTRSSNEFNLTVADAECLTCFKKESFDNVLCSEVLEHCLDPQAVLNSIYYVLKPGGFALVTTPNFNRHRPKWIGLGTLSCYGVKCRCQSGYLHTAYRPEELVTMAGNAGFEIIETGTLEKDVKYAAKFPVIFLFICKAVNWVFHSRHFERFYEIIFNRLCMLIYNLCRITGLRKVFLKVVKEGVRSYILLKK